MAFVLIQTGTFHRRLLSPMERFIDQIERHESGCWMWQGSRKSSRYGKFWMNGQEIAAHRAAWLLLKGAIPPGMLVCHRCDTPGCVNPEHLFLGTPSDNTRDMIAKGRGNRPKGEACKKAKLSAEQVRQIRQETSKGDQELARLFGVSKAAIFLIRRGKNWKHING